MVKNHVTDENIVELAELIYEEEELDEIQQQELQHISACAVCEKKMLQSLNMIRMLVPSNLEKLLLAEADDTYREHELIDRDRLRESGHIHESNS